MKKTLLEWCSDFGITPLDLEGFPDLKKNGELETKKFTLFSFVSGISFCAVRIDDTLKFKNLESLME